MVATMRIALPYGDGQVEAEIPDANVMAVATPPEPILQAPDESAEIARALANPISAPGLRELATGKRSAAVLVSDYTRPTPSGVLVPHLLEELTAGGLAPSAITVVFAVGLHRPANQEQMRSILGEGTFSRVRAVSHDCDALDLVFAGTTSQNHTPVWVNRVVADADLRVSVSAIEPHQSAGWSGGAKNLLPGACGRKTIMAHHAMSNRPGVRMGVLDGNPFRQDLEEAAAMVGLDFIVAAILTEKKRVSRLYSGHPIAAHRAAVRVAERLLTVHLPGPADIVLASVGGSPRDANFWLTEGKGFTRIRDAVRDGGIVIMAAECPEGVGDSDTAKALLGGTPDEVLARFKDAEFTVGGNKVYRMASLLKKAGVYLVTDGLTREAFGRLPINLFSNVGSALDAAFREMGPSARVVVVPRTPGVLIRAKSAAGLRA